MRVQVSDNAIENLLDIAERLSDLSPEAALRFIESYERVLAILRDFPESGQKSNHRPGVRVLRSGVYRFVYEVLPDRLVVSEIVDGRGQSALP